MSNTKKQVNPWTPEDEKEHALSKVEWWCIEAFFRTIEDNKRWSLKASIRRWRDKPITGFILSMALLDQDNNKQYIYDARHKSEKLLPAKDSFDVGYEDSFMKGTFPIYKMYFNNKKDDIKLDLEYNAEALPHWITQEITDGLLPVGLGGFYKYGFIPKGNLLGTIKINNKTLAIEGKGYFEHVWGNFFLDSLVSLKLLKKTTAIYARLIGWHLLNFKPRFPKSIIFSTENNPLGYDWVWAILDNGWSIYYGNAMFWFMKGPAAGTLILTKDGKKYEEFANIHFQYNKMKYAQAYDFFYPTEMEITATNGKEKLYMKFKMTSEALESVFPLTDSKYWLGAVICEAPGKIEGYYFDGKKKIKLSGICKIEPQRQISILGHNSLKIDILKPPNGVGISFDLESHYLKKKLFTKIQLAPRPNIKFSSKKIDNPKMKIQ